MQTLGALVYGLVRGGALGPHADVEITGVFDDSREVLAGSMFVAVRGRAQDGRRFIADAVARGARVIVGESLGRIEGVVVLEVADARAFLAAVAVRWYGVVSGERGGLTLGAVTGTNGKTTTALMARSILRAGGVRCGFLGTVFYDLCGRSVTSGMTTPGPLEVARYLRECADAGGEAAVLEVSSHALDQCRVGGLRFSAAAFTNLSGDHLDYHGTFENYREAKARLFAELDASAVAVLNRDDGASSRMAEVCRGQVLWYSLDQAADITAEIKQNTIDGTTYRLRLPEGEVVVTDGLVGRHNVYNAMAAAGLALSLGAPLEALESGLSGLRNIPGRLERVPGLHDIDVFVDYAHTDDALENVLGVLKPLVRGRLLVLFGCGGDRDRTKRARMAAAVGRWADGIVVTSDNPRTEDPQSIIADILAGFDAATRGRVMVEADRRLAIGRIVADARAGDVVLIAGKGHENYQIVGSERLHFDDVEVAIEAASALADK